MGGSPPNPLPLMEGPSFFLDQAPGTRRNTMRGRFATYLALCVLLAAGALAGCSNDDATGPRTGTMSVRMTDAPSQYDHVNLVITQVSVHRGSTVPADSDSVSGWQVISTSPLTVDLLTLRNGVFTQLAVATVVA